MKREGLSISINIKKHDFDFIRAEDVLDGTHSAVPSRRDENEPRFLAIGKIDGRFAAVVYPAEFIRRREHRLTRPWEGCRLKLLTKTASPQPGARHG